MALNEDMIKELFGDMSVDDMELLRKEVMGEQPEEKKVEPPPPPPDPQKFADAVVAKMPQPAEPPPAPLPAFDMKKFQEQFLADPNSGLDYAFQSKYGYNPLQVVPLMAAALAETKQQIEQLRSQSFRSSVQLDDESFNKVEQFRQQKGLDFQDAYDLAKVRGIIQAQTPAAPAAPPRLPRGGGKETSGGDEMSFLNQVNDLSDEKLEALFMRAGGVTKSHLT
jgi:hypothetical protein